jgi:hypothetical protein
MCLTRRHARDRGSGFARAALRAQNMGFSNPRKVTVLALIPLSLATFLGLLASRYWTMGLMGWAESFPKRETLSAHLIHLRCRCGSQGLNGDHGWMEIMDGKS